jgi:hypothetical protein
VSHDEGTVRSGSRHRDDAEHDVNEPDELLHMALPDDWMAARERLCCVDGLGAGRSVPG